MSIIAIEADRERSIGDLDGNGTLEIVVPSYDGNVYILGGDR